jgi:RHS repeat-associated protein
VRDPGKWQYPDFEPLDRWQSEGRAGARSLTYTYDNGNQLTKVTDSQGTEGFNNGSSGSGDDFSYDGNRNVTRDQNRGIVAGGIRYNILNLPREVSGSGYTLQYHYDATGAKLRMSNSNGTVNTKYSGAFEYNNSNYITRIATDEGQISVINNGANTSDYRFEYYLRDHLDNTRMVLNEAGTIVQETEYMPFGLAIPRTAGTNKYLYQGKELQLELKTYDFHARMYDPAIGRTFQIDPMSESYYSHSSYGWVMNNPLKFMDPTGMVSTHTDEDGNVVAVYDDGDLGVYKHEGQVSKADVDSKHGAKNTSAGGQKMGETEFWDEFRNPETGKEIGSISFGESWDNTIADLHKQAKGMDLLEIRTESKLRGDFDIKNREDLAANGPFTGKLLNGKYASARSAGNYLAGYNAAGGTQYGASLTRTGYLKLAGAYNMTGKLTTGMILGIILGDNSFGPAPYYGEAPYSGRRIIQGWDNKKHGK